MEQSQPREESIACQQGVLEEEIVFPDDNEKDEIIEYSPKERFYRFNEEIGFGSYKSVYRGHDSDTGKQVAWNVIKLMRLPPQQRKRLTEEISILKNISHKRVINFINAWLNKGKNEMIFITEMVSGGSLKKHLRKIKKPRLKIIKGWCREILEGLEYLHSQSPSIIHRDIKCENIFINTNTNEIRIGDLGLAISTRNSYAETLIGTPEFMAPEIFEGKYSTGVDIYAFGMCVLEMATLQTPYQECNSLPTIYKHIEHRIKPKCLELIESDPLRNFILRCIDEPNERPSASQLLEDEFFIANAEEDNREVRLKEMTTIFEVASEFEQTLKDDKLYKEEKGNKNQKGEEEEFELSDNEGSTLKEEIFNRQVITNIRQKPATHNVFVDEFAILQPKAINLFKEMYRQYREKLLNHNPSLELSVIRRLSQMEFSILDQLHMEETEKRCIKEQTERVEKGTKHQERRLTSLKKSNPSSYNSVYESNGTQTNLVVENCWDDSKDNTENLLLCESWWKMTPKQEMVKSDKSDPRSNEPRSLHNGKPEPIHETSEFRTEYRIPPRHPESKTIREDLKLDFESKMSDDKEEMKLYSILRTESMREKVQPLHDTHHDLVPSKPEEKIETDLLKDKTLSHQVFESIQSVKSSEKISNERPFSSKPLHRQSSENIAASIAEVHQEVFEYRRFDSYRPKNSQPTKSQQDIILLMKAKKSEIKFPISTDSSHKEGIILIQNILNRLLDEKIEAIGVFGHYTGDLVKRFQNTHKLKADGVISQQLFGLMLEQLQRSLSSTKREKEIREKSEELSRIRREKDMESKKLLSELENEILNVE